MRKNAAIIITILVTILIICAIFFYPTIIQQPNLIVDYDSSSIGTICELATLKSFYHNVAEFEQLPDPWFQYGFAQYGYKKLWLEYSGIVEIGIDASQIKISPPTENGVINVYIPDAKILNVTADENSLSEPISETGWFTPITGEDKALAFSAAQQAMREEAEKDQTLLNRAKQNAKLLIKQYIINTGKELGVDYTIKWAES